MITMLMLVLLGVIGTPLFVLYIYYRIKFQHWQKKKMYHIKPSFPFGNMAGSGFSFVIKDIYDLTRNHPYVGTWTLFRPSLVINDPELLKTVMVKDFNHFQDRGAYVDKENDPLGAHLFSIGGTEWRNLRVKLTPTFTSGKMKYMFQTIADIGTKLQDYLKEPAERNEVLEVKNILGRFTMEVISSCAFGLDSDALNNPNSQLFNIGQKFFDMDFIRAFQQILVFIVPQAAKLFKVRFVPKDVEKYFLSMFESTVNYRQNNNVHRKDFLQMLITLMEKGFVDDVDAVRNRDNIENQVEDNNTFTMKEAAAQAFVFFIAGFETSSTAMQFALYELALNPDIQERTRRDIRQALDRYNGVITYDGIQEMYYLDRVVSETLRKYPPVAVVGRECNKTYRIPGTTDDINAGDFLLLPVYALQHDPVYYPQPERFDPDRFLSEEKEKRHNFTYLPFGEGPRNCIGNRFGLLQSKVGLSAFISKYKVSVCDQTMIPMRFKPASNILAPDGGVYLKITRVEE